LKRERLRERTRRPEGRGARVVAARPRRFLLEGFMSHPTTRRSFGVIGGKFPMTFSLNRGRVRAVVRPRRASQDLSCAATHF
jgi:hypothetical protein